MVFQVEHIRHTHTGGRRQRRQIQFKGAIPLIPKLAVLTEALSGRTAAPQSKTVGRA